MPPKLMAVALACAMVSSGCGLVGTAGSAAAGGASEAAQAQQAQQIEDRVRQQVQSAQQQAAAQRDRADQDAQ